MKQAQKTMLSQKFHKALDYARIVHGEHTRKGTAVPALSHLLGVAALVLEYGGDEELAIAALLHDAVEDGGGEFRLQDIRKGFGDRVGAVVLACSDSLAEDPAAKQEWWARKVAYLERLRTPVLDADAALVCGADKLHNLRAMVSDYRQIGEDLWARFNPQAGRAGEIWYYQRLGEELARLPAGLNTHWQALTAELQAADAVLLDLVRARIGARALAAEMRRSHERAEEIRASQAAPRP